MRRIKHFNKVIVFTFFVILILNTTSYGKYTFETIFNVAKLDIDRNLPKIELVNVKNTNTGYESYANNTHIITAEIKVTENNIKENNFTKDNIKILIGAQEVTPQVFEIKEIEKNDKYILYEIRLSNLQGNGDLKIKVNEGTIVDNSQNRNEETILDVKIQIDNIAPSAEVNEKKQSQGKVLANIISNEAVREMQGWILSQNKLSLMKEFTNNISYTFQVIDLANNKTNVEVNITQATNINIIYGSHNSEVGWTFGYGNYDVAGKEAIKRNPKWKTEALAFNVSGNIDADFIQAQTFIYSYWGEGSEAKCTTYGTKYKYGYNPSSSTYSSMSSGTIVDINNKRYFMFGGSGINGTGTKDVDGKNPIPIQYQGTYSFGISGMKMKLKDYSYYSIVYQILVNDYGWQKSTSDGELAMYKYNKPISAFRMALIPKTEKEYLINSWNKAVGTHNVN